MATNEPTTVAARKADGKHTNPREIVWPHDEYGIASMLKKEGVRAIGRIKGDEAKLDVVMQTLRTLGEHAKVKIAAQKVEAEKQAAAQKNREEAEYARSLADQEKEVMRLKALLASAEAAVEAKKAMPGKEAE